MANRVIKRLQNWLGVLALAAPPVALYIVAHRTFGWPSLIASVFEWLYIVCMIGFGFAHGFWAWGRTLEDENETLP